MSGLWQAGLVRRTRPLNRGTLMLPLAQAMKHITWAQPIPSGARASPAVFKVMPRPARNQRCGDHDNLADPKKAIPRIIGDSYRKHDYSNTGIST